MACILVIDDDPDVLAVVQETLESAGHQTVLATNGRDGLEAYRRRPADVVLTDLFMPDREGIETIGDFEREFSGVKIIAMSGGGRSLDSTRYLSTARMVGARAVLRKPFEPSALLAAIERLLRPAGAG